MPALRRENEYSITATIVLYAVLIILVIVSLYPVLLTIVASFTAQEELNRHYTLFPKEWSFSAYSYLGKSGQQLLYSYGVSIFITVVGTFFTIVLTLLAAYALSRKEFTFRNHVMFIIFFTMLFNAGLVPSYLVMTKMLGLKDNILALILPLVVNPFYIILLRTFITLNIPDSLIEAARIDGANENYILWRIVLPLSTAGLATIAFFSVVGYWNDWFNAMLYITKPELTPLQYLLQRIQGTITFLLNASGISATQEILASLPSESIQMAMVVVASGPILIAYPFFQRYFIQGMTVGAVKG